MDRVYDRLLGNKKALNKKSRLYKFFFMYIFFFIIALYINELNSSQFTKKEIICKPLHVLKVGDPIMNTAKSLDYKQAGVNIDEGNALVKSISSLVSQTARPGAHTQLGSFGSIFDLKKLNYQDPLLISGTDGVGTKLKIAGAMQNHKTVGQDLVAMCVNDILSQGAEPLFFLDYFATGKLEKAKAYDVIAGIADGCKKSNCALIGGETAEMPGMYQPNEYDLAGFVVGIVERDQLLPKIETINSGDIVIGLASSGAHSNGFSLIRKIIDDWGFSLHEAPPFDSPYKTLGDLLLEPTLIYTESVLPLCKQNMVKGIAHITGGGLLENIPRILPSSAAVELDMSTWQVPELFKWIQQTAYVAEKEMQRTFNLGIGMVLIVDPSKADEVLAHFDASSCTAYTIGIVTNRNKDDEQVIIN